MKLRIFALCFAVALFMWVPARAAEPVPVEIVSVYQGSKNYYDNKCYSVSWYDSAGVYHSKWMSKAEYNNLRKACERNAATSFSHMDLLPWWSIFATVAQPTVSAIASSISQTLPSP